MIGAALALGCEERPPPIPLTDSGPFGPRDAAVLADADALPSPGRPDGGPRLPPADREIVLPYFGDPVVEMLEFESEVGQLDVFFSVDTTGSFGGEIDNLQSELRRFILPELRARVDDVAFGVGRFEDFPTPPFGEPGDRPFALATAITTDEGRIARAVAALDQPLGHGGDIPESGFEALYQIATGVGYGDIIPPFSRKAAPGGGTLGGVGFREHALRVVVHATDAPSHDPADYEPTYPGTRSREDAIEALSRLGVRTLGIASHESARSALEAIAIGTGAVIADSDGECRTGIDGASRPPRAEGCPLVFDVRPDGTGLAEVVVDAIADLLASVRYAEVWGESDDAFGFVRTIEALDAETPSGVAPPSHADLRPMGDGIDDTFLDVGPGTRLRMRAHLRNESLPPTDYDQIFNLTLRVVGDGVELLSRRLRVVVPRGRLDAGMPSDVGLDGAAPEADAGPADP